VPDLLIKDQILDRLAEHANVAQFVSFAPSPDLPSRFSRIIGYPPNHCFPSSHDAVAALLHASPETTVNIRSFDPASPKSHDFLYGLHDVDTILVSLHQLSSRGLFTIVNETIDLNDGGVSGVLLGGVLEFAPNDTPRCVEKPGTLSLPFDLGERLLQTVYHFAPDLPPATTTRIEFSIHPIRRGFRHDHTIIWEEELVDPLTLAAAPTWPNRFSRHIGDKAFGLLIADLLGLPVPATTVIPRWLPPFQFGRPTGSGETWIRTCPTEQVPGRFTTHHGWLDPFSLLNQEDPSGDAIASVLAQEGITPHFSGAAITQADGSLLIEGVPGRGDAFMLGQQAPHPLPSDVTNEVRQLAERASSLLGPIRCEWVHDGSTTWIVQLHHGSTTTTGRVIVPGEARSYHRFPVTAGVEALRTLLTQLDPQTDGIILVGNIGITSHLGDILRRAQIPSCLEPSGDQGKF
jgi:hypothetical protein